MSPEERAESVFREHIGRDAMVLVRAPGRVNLLGEHVDYNDGFVLPAAIDKAVFLAAAPRADGVVAIHASDLGEDVAFRCDEAALGIDRAGHALPRWAKYPAGVAACIGALGLAVGGMDAVVVSDLPRGAGLSSSAALEVAFARAWQALGGWSLADVELADLCRRAEQDAVGVACGIMDQLAAVAGRAGHVLLVDCRSSEVRAIPFPSDVAIVVADSGVRRELSSSAYNDRRAECDAALRALVPQLPRVRALRDVSVDDLAKHGSRLPPILRNRARHVVEECARVRKGSELLAAGRVAEVGPLLDASHRSLAELYDVSCAELDALAAAAQRSAGCLGARLTGAGFGGCIVALVHTSEVARFGRDLAAGYAIATGREATAWICTPSDGATVRSGSRARPRG